MDSVYAALQRFNDDLMEFPSYVAAFKEIEGLLRLYRASGLAQHLVVLGESGSGKTTLCRDLLARHPRVVLDDGDVLPVLYISIPPLSTIGSVVEALLIALGDPFPGAGTLTSRTTRVGKLAKGVRVELLLIDEAQHIRDRGQLTSQYLVGDWLKDLMDALEIPTVLLGLPRVVKLLQVNEQLRRRFSRRRNLQMGMSKEATLEEECLQLFLSMGDSLPVPIRVERFGWDELAQRIRFACDGRVAYLKKLLGGAIRLALEQSLDRIDASVLQEAFTAEVWWEGVDELNPFSEKFKLRRLNRAGEPFELALLSGRREVEVSP